MPSFMRFFFIVSKSSRFAGYIVYYKSFKDDIDSIISEANESLYINYDFDLIYFLYLFRSNF